MSRRRAPWRPVKFVVFPVGTAKTTKRAGKPVRCWDVRGHADGYPFSRRFTQPETSAGAQAYAKDLVRAFEAGQWWDPQTRSFGDPPPPEVEAPVTVVDWIAKYWEQMVPEWEPKTRIASHRTLGRAMRHLLRPEAPKPTAADLEEIAAWLSPAKSSQAGTGPSSLDTATYLVEWASKTPTYLVEWSKPIAEVTHEDLEALLTIYRKRQNGTGQIAPGTEARTVAVLRACWTQAVARGLIARDPWPAVRTMRKARKAGKVLKAATGVQEVSPDIVLSPAQVWELAEACATVSERSGVYRAYVSTMGLCGLRPGEAAGLQISDLDLPAVPGASGWITLRRNRRPVADRWLIDGEDGEHGPLKGRSSDTERKVPVPSTLVGVLRDHLEQYRKGSSLDGPVFVAVGGSPIDPSRFKRDVWTKALPTLWTSGPLATLRRHDLRHAACSAWLAAGVPMKQASAWSGHATLSVFLDIYQGIMPSDESMGVARLEAYLSTHAAPQPPQM